MWPVFLVVLVLVGLCVLGLGVNVLFFRRDFPQSDVGSNEQMRRRGIRCFKEEDGILHRRICRAEQTPACQNCHLYHPPTP